MANLSGKTLGNYTLGDLLGKGGMASVYRAHQNNMKRDVAVKVIESELASSEEFIRRFEREVETIASFSNAHILKVFDFGQADGLVFLVMELLQGGNLADMIKAGPVPLRQVSRILDQICSALDYAHRRGVVHRDIKPQNIMLDEDGNAFITDFGIAKAMSGGGQSMTQTGAIMGTPSYMAPEQWRSEPVDGRTDTYAVGIILFEMLSGKLPFQADTAYGMMHKHLMEDPPLRTMDARFAPGLERMLTKAMAKAPENRYGSAGDLAAAFKAAVIRHNLVDSPYTGEAAGYPDDDAVTLIEIPLDDDDTAELDANVMVDVVADGSDTAAAAVAAAAAVDPLGQTNLSRPTAAKRPDAALSAVPVAESAPKPPNRGLLIGLLAVFVLSVIGGFVIATNGRSNPTPTVIAAAPNNTTATGTPSLTSTLTASPTATFTSSATATLTNTATNTDVPLPQTQVALTLAGRITQTAVLQASFTATETPNLEQTTVALLAQNDTATAAANTAIAVSSFTATATATASPTATITNTPEPCVVQPINARVRVHVGAGRNRTVLRFLDVGKSFTVIAQATDATGLRWFRVDLNASGVTEGWVALEDLKTTGDCGASILPTSSPRATIVVPTVTRTPTPRIQVAADACFIVPAASLVSVYRGPGRNRIVLRILADDQRAAIVEQTTDKDGNLWYRLNLTDVGIVEGWVAAVDVSLGGNCTAIPTQKPPTMTPTETRRPSATASPTVPPTSTVKPSATKAIATVPTQTAISEDACVLTTNSAQVRVHLGPGRNRTVLRFLTAGQRYIALEQGKASDGSVWYRIELSAVQVPVGWVSAEDVTLTGNCAALKDSSNNSSSGNGGATASATPPTTIATISSVLPTAAQSEINAVGFTQTTTVPASALNGAADCVLTPTQAQTRVHLGPGRNRTVLRFVTPNEVYTAIAQAKDSEQMMWYRIDLSAAKVAVAWVAAEDVMARGDCAALAADASATLAVPATEVPATVSVAATITPSITASPTATNAATVDPDRCSVASSLLQARVHLGAGRNRTVLRFLTQNQRYVAIAQAKDGTNMTWYRLDLSAVGVVAAWVAAEDVTTSGPCAALPTS